MERGQLIEDMTIVESKAKSVPATNAGKPAFTKGNQIKQIRPSHRGIKFTGRGAAKEKGGNKVADPSKDTKAADVKRTEEDEDYITDDDCASKFAQQARGFFFTRYEI